MSKIVWPLLIGILVLVFFLFGYFTQNKDDFESWAKQQKEADEQLIKRANIHSYQDCLAWTAEQKINPASCQKLWEKDKSE
ncbi:hypothetical protein [Basilea psittacipulmonis]|uniref:Uncharacterized protein n=1 Tax=Basilea psittacipulmonis DSM 24701 TaxID=1072685 RepID=A0A077DCC4_9BURK|nr:hypothetical protein [Basilea psittacipulmonis]AIL32550.1 hypothetical protein IX83_03820 [Basilea psittacipulmonis DSM 24701]